MPRPLTDTNSRLTTTLELALPGPPPALAGASGPTRPSHRAPAAGSPRRRSPPGARRARGSCRPAAPPRSTPSNRLARSASSVAVSMVGTSSTSILAPPVFPQFLPSGAGSDRSQPREDDEAGRRARVHGHGQQGGDPTSSPRVDEVQRKITDQGHRPTRPSQGRHPARSAGAPTTGTCCPSRPGGSGPTRGPGTPASKGRAQVGGAQDPPLPGLSPIVRSTIFTCR